MLPAVPNAIRDHKKTNRCLDAAQLSRAFMTKVQDQDVNVNQGDPQEDNVNQDVNVKDWRAVDLEEDGFGG